MLVLVSQAGDGRAGRSLTHCIRKLGQYILFPFCIRCHTLNRVNFFFLIAVGAPVHLRSRLALYRRGGSAWSVQRSGLEREVSVASELEKGCSKSDASRRGPALSVK